MTINFKVKFSELGDHYNLLKVAEQFNIPYNSQDFDEERLIDDVKIIEEVLAEANRLYIDTTYFQYQELDALRDEIDEALREEDYFDRRERSSYMQDRI